jgi:hypothetical protein
MIAVANSSVFFPDEDLLSYALAGGLGTPRAFLRGGPPGLISLGRAPGHGAQPSVLPTDKSRFSNFEPSLSSQP